MICKYVLKCIKTFISRVKDMSANVISNTHLLHTSRPHRLSSVAALFFIFLLGGHAIDAHILGVSFNNNRRGTWK